MSKKILVCDDEPDLVQIVMTILQTKGYEIEVAHDGAEALRRIGKEVPDLLLIDLVMPRISGLEVVRRLQRDDKTKDLPIIVMSGAGRETGKDESFFREGLGIDDYVTKPFDPLNLLGRVEAVLRMRDYHSSKNATPSPTEPQQAPSSPPVKTGFSVEELEVSGPADVVKIFIESWNTQDFTVEYECLDPGMTGNLPLKSYILRRQQAYMDDKGLDRQQRVKRVVEMDAKDTEAHIVVEREDSVRGRARLRMEEYHLIRAQDHWRIKMVRPVAA